MHTEGDEITLESLYIVSYLYPFLQMIVGYHIIKKSRANSIAIYLHLIPLWLTGKVSNTVGSVY